MYQELLNFEFCIDSYGVLNMMFKPEKVITGLMNKEVIKGSNNQHTSYWTRKVMVYNIRQYVLVRTKSKLRV